MPSLIDLRRRIRSVKNTQQITKAMKMVASSKLRRVQERIMNARPYAVQMQRVLSSGVQTCTLGLVGRKGREFFGRRGFEVMFDQTGIFQKLRFDDAQVIAKA